MILRSLVREARKRAGLTQVALAKRAGVSGSTVSRVESGARTPSTDLVERLVRATGYEIRVGLGEPDLEIAALLDRNLRLSPQERFANAVRAARFVLRGRRSLEKRTRPGRMDG